MNDVVSEIKREMEMGDTEVKIRYALGSAAGAAAIFAPLSYKWKAVLTAIAADAILTGAFGFSPWRRFVRRAS